MEGTFMIKIKTILPVVAVVLTFFLVFAFLTELLSPKYATELVEGSMISQYYDEAGDHDVIFIGDCEVYANVSPMEMYRYNGITAYVRGTPQQLLWQSYYILKETLRYETPKVVVFNVNAMRHSEPVSEAYNRLTIDQMRWSKEKIDIINASMTEEETFWSYVFPILRYHSRFDELTQEDFAYLFRRTNNTWNGHLINQEVNPVGTLPAKRVLSNYQFSDICYEYLEKMVSLCKSNGIEMILMKAPSLYPYWYDQYDAQIADFANAHGIVYYDFTKAVDEIGLDYQVDTYDGGLHLNLNGAVKFSKYLSNILADRHGVSDHRYDMVIADLYNAKLGEYDQAVLNGKVEIQ